MTVDDFLKLVKSADSDKRLKGQKFSSFSDSFRYAEMRSEIIGQLMEQNILDLDDRETACLLTLKEQYAPINSVCGQVQRSLDRKTGLHLTPQKADFPLERVMTLAHSLTDPTVPDETIQRRARSGTETIILSIHDDYIEENAKFRTKAGIKCYITRTTDGKCCPWCTSIAGRYEYGKEPSDIYSRHDNCTCSVTFENGRERQDVWSKRKWEVKDEYQPKVFSRQQAEQIQSQNLNFRGLTNSQNGGIIEENKKLYPDTLANVKRGKPMTFEQADSGNVNPHYGENGYDTNCQICTIVNEARRRGYDVEALPNTLNSIAEKLAKQYTFAWIDPKTGKRPEFVKYDLQNSPKKYLEFMHSTIKQGERYVIGFTWKGKSNSGHIVNLDINENGELRIKDNQRGLKERSEWTGDKAVLKYLKKTKWSETISGYKLPKSPKMLRIDNLQFEPDVMKKIMKGRDL